MKCVVCCLLTFCAFRIVFTMDEVKEKIPLEKSNPILYKTVTRIADIYREIISDVNLVVGGTIYKEQIIEQCWLTNTYNQVNQNYNAYVYKCNMCHKKAAKKLFFKSTKKCCIKEIAELENMRKIVKANLEKCKAHYIKQAQAATGTGPTGAVRINK
ncbi:uncharacterized protein LOC117174527 [Belonocnema kinseyi]|uniref:uncharacterized protein LOC117174527 n=1 Tax=Belonocnema kinseyi TaxID=2817044 RepID=UPI00143D0977|nr:uncharacterized protein LOC117174527 [Belonocnema kinseyi]